MGIDIKMLALQTSHQFLNATVKDNKNRSESLYYSNSQRSWIVVAVPRRISCWGSVFILQCGGPSDGGSPGPALLTVKKPGRIVGTYLGMGLPGYSVGVWDNIQMPNNSLRWWSSQQEKTRTVTHPVHMSALDFGLQVHVKYHHVLVVICVPDVLIAFKCCRLCLSYLYNFLY